jgi:hypothetical protein
MAAHPARLSGRTMRRPPRARARRLGPGRAALATAVALLLASGAASADKRVAIGSIEGDAQAGIEQVLVELLDEDFKVITPKVVDKLIAQLDLGQISDRDMNKLAKALDADAVVVGEVEREGKSFRLSLRLRIRGDRRIAELTATFRQAGAEATRRALRDNLRTALQDLIEADTTSPTGDGIDDENPLAAARGDGKGDDDDDDDDDGKGDDGDDDDDDDDGDGDDGDDDDQKARPGVARTPRDAAILLEVGPSLMSRQLSFNSRGNFPEAPKGYQGPLVPGVRVRAEAYPMAASNPGGFVGGFGLGLDFDRVLTLTTRTSAARDVPLSTTSQYFSVGARLRLAVGRRPTSPTITVGFGYAQRAFTVDRSPLPDGVTLDLPDVNYTFLEPRLAARVPVTSKVALRADLRALLVQSTGDIASADQYGDSSAFGFDGALGLQILLGRHLVTDLSFQFVQIGHTFDGGAEMTDNRDMMPGKDVGGAADRYLGLTASVGVVY